MKKLIILAAVAATLSVLLFKKGYSLVSCSTNSAEQCGEQIFHMVAANPPAPPEAETSIQVAILLDASNSMDGLIDQAKSRLWNIVNTLTTLKYKGQTPAIEIALYMYGNDGLSAESNYIKQITPFTSDLDLISEKLFSITTNGGSEYCGAVISDAVKKLNWGIRNSDMKLIYIAGNEPFNQGKVSYKEAISAALAKDIYINTIHCGTYGIGENEFWKDGAIRGKGKYFCINSDEAVAFIETPYDVKIDECNTKLNGTYIYYGANGNAGYAKLHEQDNNANFISKENKVERSVSKSKAIYKNDSWDLVDKVKSDSTYIQKVEPATLPKEYQALSKEKLKATLKAKSDERVAIQKEIGELSKKRQQYIDTEAKKSNVKDDFGKVVQASIYELAKAKGYDVN